MNGAFDQALTGSNSPIHSPARASTTHSPLTARMSPQRAAKEQGAAFDRALAEAARSIESLQTSARGVSQLISLIGHRHRDGAQLRARIEQECAVCHNLARDAPRHVDALRELIASNASSGADATSPLPRTTIAKRQQQHRKLARDLAKAQLCWDDTEAHLQEAQRSHKLPAWERRGGESDVRVSGPMAGSASRVGCTTRSLLGWRTPSPCDGASTPLLLGDAPHERDELLQHHVDLNEQLVRERGDEVAKIAQQMAEVQTAFREVATLVSEQQQDIDVIEENAESAAERAEDGCHEIAQAAEKQQGASKCFKVALCFVVVAVAAVVAFVVFAHSRSRGE